MTPLPDRPPWHDHAACRGGPPDRFYRHPDEREYQWAARRAEARVVCLGCPVRQECLNHAIVQREPEGVWGGCEFPTEWRRALRLAARFAAAAAGETPRLSAVRDPDDDA